MNSTGIWKTIRDIGLVGIIGWLIARLISDMQQQTMTKSAEMMTAASRDMTDVIKAAADVMLEGINGPKNIPQPRLTAEEAAGNIDDPTQGEGPIPWYQLGEFANDGGPMTRPIDPTDNDWPDPITNDPAHRTTMIPNVTSANLLDQIAHMDVAPETVAFGADGFPVMGNSQAWSAVPRPDMAGETWQDRGEG